VACLFALACQNAFSFSRIPVGSYRGRQLVARQLIRK
jgi:hypothetical protein